MEFHPSKCNVLHITRKRSKIIHPYTLHGQALEEVSLAKYLRVTVSDDMTWNRHIDNITSKQQFWKGSTENSSDVHCILNLPQRTAMPSLHILSGILPIEATLNQQKLTLLCTSLCNLGPLQDIIIRQLAVNPFAAIGDYSRHVFTYASAP